MKDNVPTKPPFETIKRGQNFAVSEQKVIPIDEWVSN